MVSPSATIAVENESVLTDRRAWNEAHSLPRRAKPWLVLAGLLVISLVAALVLFLSDGPAPPISSDDAAADQLWWPPPEGWEDFTPVDVEPIGGRIRLDDDEDYRLEAPDVVTGGVEIVGGRHVVWVGGHLRIDDAGLVGAGERRGLLVRDDGDESDGRTVHLEGLLIDGNDLSEGVDIDAPSAVVQLANIHVETVGFRNADDRDGTGSYEELGDNHPDVIQTYGGFRELRIDGLTAASAYQGLFFKVDSDEGTGRPVKMRRVDVRAVSRDGTDGVQYAGNRMFFWDVDTVGDVWVESGTVWVQHHPDAGKVAGAPNPRSGSGSWWRGAYRDGEQLVEERPPGTARPVDAVERRQSVTGESSTLPATGQDDFGAFFYWPDGEAGRAGAELLGLVDGEGGRIYGGTPPGGSFVSRDAVGLDYRSPGFQDR